MGLARMINPPPDDHNALAVHLRNCRLGLDLGTAQAKWGFFATAAHEVYLVEQELKPICLILASLDSEPARKQLSADLDLILIRLSTLRSQIFRRTWKA
jgi:hypothetical protein